MATITPTPVSTVEGSYVQGYMGAVGFYVFDLAMSGTITATNGDAVDFGKFGRITGNGDIIAVVIPYFAGYSFVYDYANDKIKIFQGDNDAGADGPGAQLGAVSVPAAIQSGVRALVWMR